MKSFGQFLTEAVKTAASTEAKLKGLKGDGHGGWYDQKGNFVAKTVNGKLQFTGGKSAAPTEDPKTTKVATPEIQKAKPKAPVQAAPVLNPKQKKIQLLPLPSLQRQALQKNRAQRLWVRRRAMES